MRRLLTTTTALLALAAPLLAAAPSSAAPPDVTIKPGTLTRGPDVSGVHLEGKTIVDGDVRVTLKAPRVLLYGKSDDVYVAATGDKEWGNVKLWQVTASGATKQLAKFIDPFNTLLDADGGQVAYSYGDSTSKPTIAVYDLALKSEVSVNAFASLPTLLDFDEGSVVASFADFKVKTIRWDTVSDETVRLNTKFSNFASQAHNLLGFFSKDPFNGGCQVLAHLDDLTTRALDQLRRADRGRLARRQAGGHDRPALRRHRPGRRDGAQDRRRAGRALLDRRLLRPDLVGDRDQAADGGQRQDPGRHRAVQGRRLQPGQRPGPDAGPLSGQPVRAARRAARTIGACKGNRP